MKHISFILASSNGLPVNFTIEIILSFSFSFSFSMASLRYRRPFLFILFSFPLLSFCSQNEKQDSEMMAVRTAEKLLKVLLFNYNFFSRCFCSVFILVCLWLEVWLKGKKMNLIHSNREPSQLAWDWIVLIRSSSFSILWEFMRDQEEEVYALCCLVCFLSP